MSERTAIYPGTFDPITFGHMDVINRAMKLFDKIIVLVSNNPRKETLLTLEERLSTVRNAVKGRANVEVDSFDGLLVDYAKKNNANFILRGLRALSDFEYEFQAAITNRKLASEIDSVFIMTSAKYFYLNSSLVKEIAFFGGDVSAFVSEDVGMLLKTKLKQK